MTSIDKIQPNIIYVTTPLADFIPCEFIKQYPKHTDFLFFHRAFQKEEGIQTDSSDDIIYAMGSEYNVGSASFSMILDPLYDITLFWVKDKKNVGIVRDFIESVIQKSIIFPPNNFSQNHPAVS